jgi:hypothetical protein
VGASRLPAGRIAVEAAQARQPAVRSRVEAAGKKCDACCESLRSFVRSGAISPLL